MGSIITLRVFSVPGGIGPGGKAEYELVSVRRQTFSDNNCYYYDTTFYLWATFYGVFSFRLITEICVCFLCVVFLLLFDKATITLFCGFFFFFFSFKKIISEYIM